MESFAERFGHREPSNILQLNGMDDRLRNRIWNGICAVTFGHFEQYTNGTSFSSSVARTIQPDFFGQPNDEINVVTKTFRADIKKRYMVLEWYDVYSFVEFLASSTISKTTQQTRMRVTISVNSIVTQLEDILIEEKSGYRFLESRLLQITNETELEEVRNAVNQNDNGSTVGQHIKAAANLYSDRKKPDYRNSIKESISAVEAAAKLLAGPDIKTLGEALKVLGKDGTLHKALASGYSSLYGWTNDSEGIRHALMDEATITEADARYMLVSCSAFSNYLLSKI